jgi:CRP/FNR family cyclic AMP-dependent transcriptional regulator
MLEIRQESEEYFMKLPTTKLTPNRRMNTQSRSEDAGTNVENPGRPSPTTCIESMQQSGCLPTSRRGFNDSHSLPASKAAVIPTATQSGVETLYDIIAEQAFFRGLSAEHLRRLADSAMRTWFEADELIFHEGDIANRFYLIVAGKVALEAPDGDGRVILLQTIGNSELLGWSWMFSPYIWHLHARAVEPTEAIFFYGTRLRELCETDHDLGYEVFRRVGEVMMQRLQTTRLLLLEKHYPDPDLTTSSDWPPGQH